MITGRWKVKRVKLVYYQAVQPYCSLLSGTAMKLARYIPLILLLVSSSSIANKGSYFADLNWVDAKERLKSSPIVIVPFAAGAKEHGPHLPMNADQKTMEYLLEEAVRHTDVLIVPPILHGWFPAFRDFPGTEVKDPDLFRRYAQQVAESVIRQGAQRVIFLNMGILKATGLPLAIAAREIRTELGIPTLLVNWEDLENDQVAKIFSQLKDGHGDEVETSIALYLQPENVIMSRASKDYRLHLKKDYPGYRPGLFSLDRQDPNYSATGISGDPTLATAEKGKQILKIMSEQLVSIIEGFARSPTRKKQPN